MSDSSDKVDVGLLYMIDAAKGKKISIFLQIWTRKCVYIYNSLSAFGVTQSVHAKICIGMHQGLAFKFAESFDRAALWWD